jgi:hypothetical protein
MQRVLADAAGIVQALRHTKVLLPKRLHLSDGKAHPIGLIVGLRGGVINHGRDRIRSHFRNRVRVRNQNLPLHGGASFKHKRLLNLHPHGRVGSACRILQLERQPVAIAWPTHDDVGAAIV